jgi:hypothetical protein
MASAKGKKIGPPDKKHWQNFNDALEDALNDADKVWPGATKEVTVTLEATVKTQSPGNIHEYRVILTPKP